MKGEEWWAGLAFGTIFWSWDVKRQLSKKIFDREGGNLNASNGGQKIFSTGRDRKTARTKSEKKGLWMKSGGSAFPGGILYGPRRFCEGWLWTFTTRRL